MSEHITPPVNTIRNRMETIRLHTHYVSPSRIFFHISPIPLPIFPIPPFALFRGGGRRTGGPRWCARSNTFGRRQNCWGGEVAGRSWGEKRGRPPWPSWELRRGRHEARVWDKSHGDKDENCGSPRRICTFVEGANDTRELQIWRSVVSLSIFDEGEVSSQSCTVGKIYRRFHSHLEFVHSGDQKQAAAKEDHHGLHSNDSCLRRRLVMHLYIADRRGSDDIVNRGDTHPSEKVNTKRVPEGLSGLACPS